MIVWNGRGGDIEGENSSLPVPSLSSLTPLTPVSCPLKHFSLKISKMFAILDFSLLSTSQSSNSPMFHPVTTDNPPCFLGCTRWLKLLPFSVPLWSDCSTSKACLLRTRTLENNSGEDKASSRLWILFSSSCSFSCSATGLAPYRPILGACAIN